jgi:PKD repeat protein
VVGPQAVTSAAHTYTSAGTYTVTLVVADTGGLTSTATHRVVVRANLVADPGFESDTSGWGATGGPGATLTRVAGGHSEDWAARVENTAATATKVVLDDVPGWVTTSVAGRYTATIWVRADAAGAVLRLRWREFVGTEQVGTKSTSIRLTTAWQQIQVRYRPSAPGSSALDLNALIREAQPGTGFDADDATIVRT